MLFLESSMLEAAVCSFCPGYGGHVAFRETDTIEIAAVQSLMKSLFALDLAIDAKASLKPNMSGYSFNAVVYRVL
jgi:hypothetical protein